MLKQKLKHDQFLTHQKGLWMTFNSLLILIRSMAVGQVFFFVYLKSVENQPRKNLNILWAKNPAFKSPDPKTASLRAGIMNSTRPATIMHKTLSITAQLQIIGPWLQPFFLLTGLGNDTHLLHTFLSPFSVPVKGLFQNHRLLN